MKNYYIVADIGEGIPSYNFILRAKSIDIAKLKAGKILKTDYPDQWNWNGELGIDFTCREITAEQLLKDLTLN